MTAESLAARLEELEKQLGQQERVRETAEINVRHLQGACAVLRQLLAEERARAPDEAEAPSVGPDGGRAT